MSYLGGFRGTAYCPEIVWWSYITEWKDIIKLSHNLSSCIYFSFFPISHFPSIVMCTEGGGVRWAWVQGECVNCEPQSSPQTWPSSRSVPTFCAIEKGLLQPCKERHCRLRNEIHISPSATLAETNCRCINTHTHWISQLKMVSSVL